MPPPTLKDCCGRRHRRRRRLRRQKCGKTFTIKAPKLVETEKKRRAAFLTLTKVTFWAAAVEAEFWFHSQLVQVFLIFALISISHRNKT